MAPASSVLPRPGLVSESPVGLVQSNLAWPSLRQVMAMLLAQGVHSEPPGRMQGAWAHELPSVETGSS